jgi:transcriptional regulator with XRE-family HTH domain
MMNDCQSGDRTGLRGMWHQIGARLRDRRLQLGITQAATAVHLGVSTQDYEQFEAGNVRIPPALLLQAGDLFKVPLFHFFQGLPSAEDDVEPTAAAADSQLVVATDADRLAALVRDFQSSTADGQSYLLLLARAFAEDAREQ